MPVRDPVLTVLTVLGEPAAMLQTYRSLLGQTDRRWEWCVAVPDGADVRALLGLPLDPRVVSVPVGGASAGDADGLAAAESGASGAHLLALRAGDLLAPEAVEAVAGEVTEDRWAYSDEQQRTVAGEGADVWRKPDHSPELLRAQPYPVRSAFLPRTVLAELGGLRAGLASAAWYDAVLRVSEVLGPAVHVERPLVVRTDPDPATRWVPGRPEDHLRAVREHCGRVGIGLADVTLRTAGGVPIGHRLHRRPPRTPSVSIVIPTRGGSSVVNGRPRVHVVELVRSLWVEGRYPDLELVVVYDAETPSEVLDDLRGLAGDALVLTRYDGWFHFGRKCNLGAVVARGEYLCFLNDDMAVVSPHWLHEMVGLLADQDVGAVGARLLFADGTLQHVGHQYVDGRAGHAYFGWPADTTAQGALAQLPGERSGVTAACMLVRAADFRHLGGFSEEFPLNYNDVDVSLKLRERGLRVLYTPDAELFHFESQTRDPRIGASEQALLERRWSLRMQREPYVREPPLVVPTPPRSTRDRIAGLVRRPAAAFPRPRPVPGGQP